MARLTIASRFTAKNVKSLVWQGEELVDWVSGGVRYSLDGEEAPRAVYFAYRFDAACSSPSGTYSVIYERLGTKGLLLKQGAVLREINRSYYHANVYEYPVCFSQLNDGREILVHCPEEYNRIEIEAAETGKRLTESANRDPVDFFHSRFSVDPSHRYLLSAGWVWHPFDAVCVFDIERAIDDPRTLDSSQLAPLQSTEIRSAAFNSRSQLVLATTDENFDDDEYDENEIRPNSIGLWDLSNGRLLRQTELAAAAGTVFPVSNEFIVDCFEYPKLIAMSSGEVVDRLPDIRTGKQLSSIIHHIDSIPPMAVDLVGQRFAVASEDEISVVQFEQ